MITGTGVAELVGAGIFIGLLALAVNGAWTLTCWIAERPQRRSDRQPALARDQLQEFELLDRDLDTYARGLDGLYERTEDR